MVYSILLGCLLVYSDSEKEKQTFLIFQLLNFELITLKENTIFAAKVTAVVNWITTSRIAKPQCLHYFPQLPDVIQNHQIYLLKLIFLYPALVLMESLIVVLKVLQSAYHISLNFCKILFLGKLYAISL